MKGQYSLNYIGLLAPGQTMTNQTYRAKFMKNGNTTSLRCAAVINAAVAALLEELDLRDYLSHTNTGIVSTMRSAVASLTFSLKHLILAAMFYLSLILINTLTRELATFIANAVKHHHIPFWISRDVMWSLICGTDFNKILENRHKMFEVSTRKRISINEAINETLHALKIQVGFFEKVDDKRI